MSDPLVTVDWKLSKFGSISQYIEQLLNNYSKISPATLEYAFTKILKTDVLSRTVEDEARTGLSKLLSALDVPQIGRLLSSRVLDNYSCDVFTKTRLYVELMSNVRSKKNGSSVIKVLTPVKTLMLFDSIENSLTEKEGFVTTIVNKLSARQINELFAFTIHKHSEQYMMQFNQMYALFEGRQMDGGLMEFRQHRLVDRLFMNATSLNTWRTEFSFDIILQERKSYNVLYCQENPSKPWRESGVYGTRFAFVFDLLQSSAAENQHLVLEKLFRLLYASEHRALLAQFTLLVLNNEHERELFVNALIQLDAKYTASTANQSEQNDLFDTDQSLIATCPIDKFIQVLQELADQLKRKTSDKELDLNTISHTFKAKELISALKRQSFVQTVKKQLDVATGSAEIKATLSHHAHHRQGMALYVSEVLSDRVVEEDQEIMLIDSAEENDDGGKENENEGKEAKKTEWIDLITQLPSDILTLLVEELKSIFYLHGPTVLIAFPVSVSKFIQHVILELHKRGDLSNFVAQNSSWLAIFAARLNKNKTSQDKVGNRVISALLPYPAIVNRLIGQVFDRAADEPSTLKHSQAIEKSLDPVTAQFLVHLSKTNQNKERVKSLMKVLTDSQSTVDSELVDVLMDTLRRIAESSLTSSSTPHITESELQTTTAIFQLLERILHRSDGTDLLCAWSPSDYNDTGHEVIAPLFTTIFDEVLLPLCRIIIHVDLTQETKLLKRQIDTSCAIVQLLSQLIGEYRGDFGTSWCFWKYVKLLRMFNKAVDEVLVASTQVQQHAQQVFVIDPLVHAMQQFVTKVLLAVSDTSEDHSFTEKSLAQVFEQGHLYQVIRVTTILLSTTLHCLTGAVNITEGLVPCLTALNKLFLKYAKNDSSDKVTRGTKRLVILLKQILLQFDHNSDVVSGAIKALVTLANSGPAQTAVLKEDPIEPMLLFISNTSIKVDDKRKLNSFIALNVICTNIKSESVPELMTLVNKHHIVRTLVRGCVLDVKAMSDDATRSAALRVFNESLAVIQLIALRDPSAIEKVFHPQHTFLERIITNFDANFYTQIVQNVDCFKRLQFVLHQLVSRHMNTLVHKNMNDHRYIVQLICNMLKACTTVNEATMKYVMVVLHPLKGYEQFLHFFRSLRLDEPLNAVLEQNRNNFSQRLVQMIDEVVKACKR